MKRIFLAAGLGLSVVSFAMTDSVNHATAPGSHIINDTTPQDTTQPTPTPDTTTSQFNQ